MHGYCINFRVLQIVYYRVNTEQVTSPKGFLSTSMVSFVHLVKGCPDLEALNGMYSPVLLAKEHFIQAMNFCIVSLLQMRL